MRCASKKTLTDHTFTNTFFLIMSTSVMISLLSRAANGTQLLEILDTLVEDMTQQNINDAAAHYAAISAPTLEAIDF